MGPAAPWRVPLGWFRSGGVGSAVLVKLPSRGNGAVGSGLSRPVSIHSRPTGADDLRCRSGGPISRPTARTVRVSPAAGKHDLLLAADDVCSRPAGMSRGRASVRGDPTSAAERNWSDRAASREPRCVAIGTALPKGTGRTEPRVVNQLRGDRTSAAERNWSDSGRWMQPKAPASRRCERTSVCVSRAAEWATHGCAAGRGPT